MIPEDWGRPVQALRIFISSPSNVGRERELARQVIDSVGYDVARMNDIALEVVYWERWQPGMGSVDRHIKCQLGDCDLLIMVMAGRFGSPPSRNSEFESGTEMEFEEALKLRQVSSSRERPEIFCYFKKIEEARITDPGKELKRVLEFRERVYELALAQEYIDPETDFQRMLTGNLNRWILKIRNALGASRIPDPSVLPLRKFLGLSAPVGRRPNAVIVFPAAISSMLFPGVTDSDLIEATHLLPYMVLEDFQAIRKLSQCLQLAGCDEVQTVTTNLYRKTDFLHFNKLFICLPRNKPAQDCLQEIVNDLGSRRTGSRVRFGLKNAGEEFGRQALEIQWENSIGEMVRVRSPQSTYLRIQREKDLDWRKRPGSCYVVDYAVVARFDNPENRFYPMYGKLSKVFVFGLHGLGTWGAAWFLRRRIMALKEDLYYDQPAQALLRVEYEDQKIKHVTDVSDRGQGFFDEEQDEVAIAQKIADLGKTVFERH